jgi:rhodanese-related sulfurtransferase
VAEILTAAQLKAWQHDKKDFVLVDTGTLETFAVEHIPGAQNACVYEVTFLEHVKTLKGIAAGMLARVTGAGPNMAEPVVLYGSSAGSQASATGAAKLEAAGFNHVYDFRGGLAEWRTDGNLAEVDASKQLTPVRLVDGVHPADLRESRIEWTGRSLVSKHTGTISLKWGEIEIRDGQPIGAQFILDMPSIADADLVNPTSRTTLLKHLSSDDFFDVEAFPEGKFVISTIEPIAEAVPGESNFNVRGTLRLKGKEAIVDFQALIGALDEGGLAARAHFDIDRTRWGIIYGSGKFYEGLGKHLVSDLVSLDLKIVAESRLA